MAGNGKIYVSAASARFAPARWGGTFEASVLDILEQSSTGRILEFDPVTWVTRVVARGLGFASGVALSQDGKTRVESIQSERNDLRARDGWQCHDRHQARDAH